MIESAVDTRQIRTHYDNLSRFYKTLWGNHIHHGYWEDTESAVAAQIRLVERLASFAGIAKGSRGLDVGCGVGGSSVWLADELECSIHALTISPVQVNMASRLAVEAGVDDRVRFQVQDANSLDGLPYTFDFVWAVESTEHLQDKGVFIESAARRLRHGGKLALCALADSRHVRLRRT